jgi:uncharacterized protein YbjT (DUF2867 family)
VYLAAGVMATTAVLLRSLDQYEQPVQMKDSQYFLLPMLRKRSISPFHRKDLHTLAQLFVEIIDAGVSPYTVHLQGYTYNELFEQPVAKMLGPLRTVFPSDAFFSRLFLFQGYLHSRHSQTVSLALQKSAEGETLRVTGGETPEVKAILRKVVRKLAGLHPNAKENDRVNVEGSRQIFQSADRAGVERIVFVSSISAFAGARSAYGQSKLRVERMVLERPGGVVIRPGLVWGAGPGGMFGALAKQVAQGSLVPMIGSGRYPQYLVHEEDLGEAIRRAAAARLSFDAPITVANEIPWQLQDLIKDIANKQGKQITLLPLPWPAVYAGLKTAEMLGAKLNCRSDSALSLVFQDTSPDFTPANQLGLARRSCPASQTGA